MPSEEQFHITVVKQKRVRRGEESAAQVSGQEPRTEAVPAPRLSAASEQARRESAAGQSEHKPSAGEERRRSHHRHYQDFGTVNLGSMDGQHGENAASRPAPEGPSRGERQQEFFNKYDAALQRRYSTRNRGKLIRILMISLLSALIVILSLLLLTGLRDSAEETLEKPELETIPVESLDLG